MQKEFPSIFELPPKLQPEKLPVETLGGMSEGDAPVVECPRFIAEHIPRGAIEVLQARRHWTRLEAREAFLKSVNQFGGRLEEDWEDWGDLPGGYGRRV